MDDSHHLKLIAADTVNDAIRPFMNLPQTRFRELVDRVPPGWHSSGPFDP
jgi:hypothetical protein